MKLQLKQQESGFTLIELVVVIVILGILAATAVPKFVDMATDARRATAQAIVGAIGSFSAMNYGKSMITGATGVTAVTATANSTLCTGTFLGGLVSVAGVTMGSATTNATNTTTYNVEVGSGVCGTAGASVTCNVFPPISGAAVTATLICTG